MNKDWLDKQIDSYQIKSYRGSGNLGVVYSAIDTVTEQDVAIKILHDGVWNHTSFDEKVFQQHLDRFKTIRHDMVLPILDSGMVEGRFYIVTPLWPVNLRYYMKRQGGKVSIETAVAIIMQISSALEHVRQFGLLHEGHGIFHNNLKPDNILLSKIPTEDELPTIVLSDFNPCTLPAHTFNLESWRYMAPELFPKKQSDITTVMQGKYSESDLFSLGVLFYYLVSGKQPFLIEDWDDLFNHQTGFKDARVWDISEELMARAGQDLPDLRLEDVFYGTIDIPNNEPSRDPRYDIPGSEPRYESPSRLVQVLQSLYKVQLPPPETKPQHLLNGASPEQNNAQLLSANTMIIPQPDDIITRPTITRPTDYLYESTGDWQVEIVDFDPLLKPLERDNSGIVIIGRGNQEDCDIVLANRWVSRRHASLEKTNEGIWRVRDLQSDNGTYLDGVKLEPNAPYDWKRGQILQIGPYYLQLRQGLTPAQSVPTQNRLVLQLSPLKLTLIPGREQIVTLYAYNRGPSSQRWQVDPWISFPDDWLDLVSVTPGERDVLKLDQNEQGEIRFRIQVPIGVESIPGEQVYQIRLIPLDGRDSFVVDGQFTIVEKTKWELTNLTPLTVEKSSPKEQLYQATLKNQGNTPISFKLAVDDTQQKLAFADVEEYEKVTIQQRVKTASRKGWGRFSRKKSKDKPADGPSEQSKPVSGTMRQILSLSVVQYPLRYLRQLPFLTRFRSLQSRVNQWVAISNEMKRVSGQQNQADSDLDKSPKEEKIQIEGSEGSELTRHTRYYYRKVGKINEIWTKEIPVLQPGQSEKIQFAVVRDGMRPISREKPYLYPFEFHVEATEADTKKLLEKKTTVHQLPVKAVPPPNGCIVSLLGVLLGLLMVFLVFPIGRLTVDAMQAGPDIDQDTLSNWQELYSYRTNPHATDSDGDGLGDEFEVNTAGYDPNLADTDGDGLADNRELELGTRPSVEDSDGDGLLDGTEVNVYGTNPLLVDSDRDGVNDNAEVIAGTDPNAADSVTIIIDESPISTTASLSNVIALANTPTPTTVAIVVTNTPRPTVPPVFETPIPTAVPTPAIMQLTSQASAYLLDGDTDVVLNDEIIIIGDDETNNQFVSFLAFDTSSLPEGAVLQEATLILYRDLKDDLPNLAGVIVDVAPVASTNWQAEDADRAALNRLTAVEVDSNAGRWEVRLDSLALQAINEQGLTQFRIIYALPSNENNEMDRLRFYSDQYTESNLVHPTLKIVYNIGQN